MKNMAALSMDELELVSGGSYIDTGNMGEAAEALYELLEDIFDWF